MGLFNKIRNYICAIGWEEWLIPSVEYPVYKELYLEFYSTFNIVEDAYYSKKMTAARTIVFRIFGQEFSHSYASLNQALGFTKSIKSAPDYPKGWDLDVVYLKLIGQPVPARPLTSNERNELHPKEGSLLINSELRFIHRLLSIN